MDLIKTLHAETVDSNSESINSLINGVISRYNNSHHVSLESSGISKIFNYLRESINFRAVGAFQPTYVDPFKITDDWLTVKEIVMESPVTYSHTTIATICGHILKSREIIGGSEKLLDQFIKQVATLISDVDKLSTMSGLDPIVTEKNGQVHGIPALRRMLDLSRPSRVKFEHLFASVSDMNVAVAMCNDLNKVFDNVDIINMSKKIERVSELIVILEKSAGDKGNKKNIESIIKQVGLLASLFSDISYSATVAKEIGNTLNSVHRNL